MISKKEAKKIAELINSVVVYGGMVAKKANESETFNYEEVEAIMRWHDAAATELNQILNQPRGIACYHPQKGE